MKRQIKTIVYGQLNVKGKNDGYKSNCMFKDSDNDDKLIAYSAEYRIFQLL